MKLKILGSSSEGNCYLFSTKSTALIIEAGLPLIEVKKALNFNIRNIIGVLLTHQHQDHSKYIKEYLKAGLNLYASEETLNALKANAYNTHTIKEKEEFNIGQFKILPFRVIHDVYCFGFLIFHPDIGRTLFITDALYSRYRFTNLNHILIEANFSQDILDNNILKGNFPSLVRKRVMQSHMSFETAKRLFMANDLIECRNIVLLHLSRGNSNADLFKNEIEKLTGKNTIIADKGTEVDLNIDIF